MKYEIEAIFVIFVCILFGFEVTRAFLGRKVPKIVLFGIGIPIGFMVFSWILFIFNVRYVLTQALGLFVTSILFFVTCILNVFNMNNEKKHKKSMFFSKYEIIFSIIAPALLISEVLNLSVLQDDCFSRGSAYGDLPFHYNIIYSFVHGCNYRRNSVFDIKTVFFANTKLAYPVLVNFLSSVFIGCFKLSLRNSIIFPSLPVIFSVFTLLAFIVKRFTERKAAIFLAPWLFMFMSGRGFLMSLKEENVNDPNADFAQYWGCGISSYWLHPIFNVLIPQRLSLFGMPVSFAYLIVMMTADFSSVKPYVFAGLLIALMPQLQAHACIAAFEWTLAYGVIHFPWITPSKWWKQIRCYLALGFFALTLSIPQLSPYISRARGNGFFSMIPIWADSITNYFDLWWNGLFIFWAIATFFGFSILTKEQIVQYIPPMFVYIVSNFIKYQPWNVDNSKVFYAAWVPFAVSVVANYFSFLIERDNSIMEMITYILLIGCNASGIYSFYRVYNMKVPQWDGADEGIYYINRFINSLLLVTDPNDVFLTDSLHNHPIPSLGGRQVLLGYGGWLQSHNLNYRTRRSNIGLFINNLDPEYIDSENVSFLCYTELRKDEITRDIGNSHDWGLVLDLFPFKLYRRLK